MKLSIFAVRVYLKRFIDRHTLYYGLFLLTFYCAKHPCYAKKTYKIRIICEKLSHGYKTASIYVTNRDQHSSAWIDLSENSMDSLICDFISYFNITNGPPYIPNNWHLSYFPSVKNVFFYYFSYVTVHNTNTVDTQ